MLTLCGDWQKQFEFLLKKLQHQKKLCLHEGARSAEARSRT